MHFCVSSSDAGLEASDSICLPGSTVIGPLCVLTWSEAQGRPGSVRGRSMQSTMAHLFQYFLDSIGSDLWSPTTSFDSWASWESGRLNDLSRSGSNKISFRTCFLTSSLSFCYTASAQCMGLLFPFSFISLLIRASLVPSRCLGLLTLALGCLLHLNKPKYLIII